MSELRRWAGVTLAGLGLASFGGPRLAAQADPATELRAAEAVVQRVRRQRDSLAARVREREAARDRAMGWQTLQVGRLSVELLPGEAAALEAGIRQAWALVRARYGRLADSTAPLRLRLQRDSGSGDAGTSSVSIYRMDRGRPGSPVTGRRVVGSAESDSLAAAVAAAAVEALDAVYDSLFLPWGPVSLPMSESPRLRERVYVHLVTTPYGIGHACLVADILACARALGLLQPVDFFAWFTPGERRRLVGPDDWDPLNRSCVAAGFLPACDTLLARWPGKVVLPLGDADSRASLVLTMLELGGEDALARVRAAHNEPLPDRLAAGAGVSIDSLLRRWYASVVAARPLPVTVRYRDGATALLWFAVLMAMALGSTRWR